MDTTVFTALGAVLLGWVLSEASGVVSLRRNERRAIGRTLSQLIENYRRFLLVMMLFDARFLKLDERQRAIVEAGMLLGLDEMESVRGGTNEAIDAVAGVDPLLAVDVRVAYTNNLRLILAEAKSAGRSISEIPHAERHLSDLRRQLAALLRKLAWRHGFRTWLRVRKLLRAKPQLVRILSYTNGDASLAQGSDRGLWGT